jgi:hypothetical protein
MKSHFSADGFPDTLSFVCLFVCSSLAPGLKFCVDDTPIIDEK